MFEDTPCDPLAGWVTQLAGLPRDVSDAERVSRLRVLEEISCAVAAAQARDAADLDTSRRAQQAAAGSRTRRGEGVASEVALARRVSPYVGARLLGLAKVLTSEMPRTLELMTRGDLSEWRAMLLARETACLEPADRQVIDEELCGGAEPPVVGLGDGQLVTAVKRIALSLDPASVVARSAKAAGERCVTIRPAPDTMTWVSALLPVADGVGVYAALKRAADTARSAPGGEPRTRGQVMADTLVARVTGRNPLERPVDVALQVVLPAELLTGAPGAPDDGGRWRGDDVAHVDGVGPVPGPWVRALVAEASLDLQARVFVRQLYSGPHGGLVAAASKARLAPAGLADLVRIRDGSCRTPWCGAPIRHIDHVQAWDDGGPTQVENLQGLCERCNHARQALGWTARSGVDAPGRDGHAPDQQLPGRHEVQVRTPSGHRYSSVAPPLPGHHPVPPLPAAQPAPALPAAQTAPPLPGQEAAPPSLGLEAAPPSLGHEAPPPSLGHEVPPLPGSGVPLGAPDGPYEAGEDVGPSLVVGIAVEPGSDGEFDIEATRRVLRLLEAA